MTRLSLWEAERLLREAEDELSAAYIVGDEHRMSAAEGRVRVLEAEVRHARIEDEGGW